MLSFLEIVITDGRWHLVTQNSLAAFSSRKLEINVYAGCDQKKNCHVTTPQQQLEQFVSRRGMWILTCKTGLKAGDASSASVSHTQQINQFCIIHASFL